jgi:5-methylcytosine-specific restriction endonuclease McrA
MSNTISGSKRVSVYAKTSGLCAYCGIELYLGQGAHRGKQRKDKFVVDHVKPLSRGGLSDIENLLPSCRLCNARKGSSRLEDFRFKLAWLDNAGILFSIEQLEWLRENGYDVPAYEDDYEFYFETL